MPKPFVFNWTLFKGKGNLFQDLCGDVLRAHGFEVRVMASGGDSGRDIEVYLSSAFDFSKDRHADWWVECKSRIGEAGSIPARDLNTNFGFAIVERIKRLLFITNHHFSNDLHSLIQHMNRMRPGPLSVRAIEREELETFIKQLPSIYVHYFDPTGTPEQYAQASDQEEVDIEYSLSSPFLDDDPKIRLTYRNRSLRSHHLTTHLPDGSCIDHTLSPLDEQHLEYAASAYPTDHSISCILDSQSRVIHPLGTIPTALRPRIDRIFIDTSHYVDMIQEGLMQRCHIYLKGAAGVGKTRLLKEVARATALGSVTIDLSASGYKYDLLQHLVMHALNTDAAFLQLLPHSAVNAIFADLGCPPDEARILAGYLTAQQFSVTPEALVNIAFDLFAKIITADIVFVDNIHCFSMLDLHLFRRLLTITTKAIVFSARDAEMRNEATALFMEELEESTGILVLELGCAEVSSNISAFVERVASDGDTLTFLQKYRALMSFHSVMLSLKSLRMAGVLQQSSIGQFRLISRQRLTSATSQWAYVTFTARFTERYDIPGLDDTLRLAASYGYFFPPGLVTHCLGDAGSAVLDALLAEEFLVMDSNAVNGALNLRFDHELTREIIYNATPPLRRHDYHWKVIAYMESLTEQDPAYSNELLAVNCEKVSDLTKAIVYWNRDAKRLEYSGRIAEAHKTYLRSASLVDTQYRDTTDEFYGLEAETLLGLIHTGFETAGAEAMHGRLRELEVLLHLHRDQHKKGLVFEFFARYHSARNEAKQAFDYIDHALGVFVDVAYRRDYARCLNLKGNLVKKFRDAPIVALRLHRQAMRHFTEMVDYIGKADTFAQIGAVLLEAGRGNKTIRWWRRRYDLLEKTSNFPGRCHGLVDYAYLVALLYPDEIDAESRLLAAVSLARKLSVKPDLCRALINYGNYYFFHRNSSDLDKTVITLTEALKLSKEMSSSYLELLSRFSLLTFRLCAEGKVDSEEVATLAELTRHHCLETSDQGRKLGDNRLVNILSFLQSNFPSEAAAVFGNANESPWTSLLFSKGEARGNPYVRGEFFATYY